MLKPAHLPPLPGPLGCALGQTLTHDLVPRGLFPDTPALGAPGLEVAQHQEAQGEGEKLRNPLPAPRRVTEEPALQNWRFARGALPRGRRGGKREESREGGLPSFSQELRMC